MFCVIASYDTVVSHSPCKQSVSIQKNKIEAGNWLSRAGEKERAERSAVSIPVFPQWLSPTRSWASSETFVFASLACPGEWGWLGPGNITHWGKDKVQQGSGEVRGGVRIVHKQSQGYSGAARPSYALFIPEKVAILCVCMLPIPFQVIYHRRDRF